MSISDTIMWPSILLHGRGSFAHEEVLRLSSRYKAAVTSNMSKVLEMISVSSLLPHLLGRRLLTQDEAFAIDGTEVCRGGARPVYELLRILNSKGPTAFKILVECIRDEKQHRGHGELYHILTEGQPVQPSPKPAKPSELRYGNELSSQAYHDRRHEFERYYHSGQWDECAKLAEDCMKSEVAEDKVVGHLELALSYVFRNDEDNVLKHVDLAHDLCKHIENSHRTFLQGRGKYILALLYHYLNQLEYAKKYIAEAKDILFGVEIGEDKSFAAYCDAVISANTLTDKSSSYEFHEVIQKFETSLHFSSNSYDMDILTIYSYLRLGRLYLGRTETKLTKCMDSNHIQMARDCQLKLKSDFYPLMDDRRKALYHLTEFDISILTRAEPDYAQRVLNAADVYVKRSKCSVDELAVRVRRRELSIFSPVVV